MWSLVEGIVTNYFILVNTLFTVSVVTKFDDVLRCPAPVVHNSVTIFANYKWVSSTDRPAAACTDFKVVNIYHH